MPIRTTKELHQLRDNLAVQIASLAAEGKEAPTELLDRYLDLQRAVSARVLGKPDSTVATSEGVVIAEQRHIDLTDGAE
ncbi:hypothetical protein MHK74_14085 [Microbacterium aurum]|uniref:hypothetical protein n=1 Tax=Microbacterium aurum TaxID=36805 RepID=UPI001EF5A0BA|nr:hypothetical protein [Microbacterium aurum]MCG7415674.1 hypothetical protein [Microbacterium aurum]